MVSNATPKVTFEDLMKDENIPSDFLKSVKNIDYTSPVTKINVAVNKLPNFLANPNTNGETPMPHHQTTIHLNCEDSQIINDAYEDAQRGNISKTPLIEMTIPSSLDSTIAPKGCHVCLLFTQYTPYTLSDGKEWDEETKEDYANHIFNTVEEYAPGFKESIVGKEVLSPPDLERIFGLTGGSISHGSMTLDQLYLTRPVAKDNVAPSTPIDGLFLCGAGCHPGGGVMGTPGRLAAKRIVEKLQKKWIFS